uniref:Uncharacterized protein n=1 Tax=Rhizophora mucronata TaxID=61149 RepID=A0A2P2JPZ8_RHIMU
MQNLDFGLARAFCTHLQEVKYRTLNLSCRSLDLYSRIVECLVSFQSQLLYVIKLIYLSEDFGG